METYKVLFEKLSPEGKGVTFLNNKPVYVAGALPGEEAIIELTENKHYKEGKIVEWIKRSEHLVSPKEEHYMTCSPLQVLDYSYQIQLKKSVLENCFKDFANEEVRCSKFYESSEIFGYRNKLEFHFVVKDSKLFLGFTKKRN